MIRWRWGWSPALLWLVLQAATAWGNSLTDIQARGVLRHAGVIYARFVTGSGDGFSVDLARGFADTLGVSYVFVPEDWDGLLPSLAEERADLVACGLTRLPWREKQVCFSSPTFCSAVWAVAGAASGLHPIAPGETRASDRAATLALLSGVSVLGIARTCLDPNAYGLPAAGARPVPFHGDVNEILVALMGGAADCAILDAPTLMVALPRWAGKIKILGPVSSRQEMGVAFRKEDPHLAAAFNTYLNRIHSDGTYQKLVQRYYPEAPDHFPEFFSSPFSFSETRNPLAGRTGAGNPLAAPGMGDGRSSGGAP